MTYRPIEDWSRGARERLVDEHGAEIRLLLDLAFTDFLDDHGVSLAAFRFRGEDPVSEAVAWAVRRFTTADIDPGKLHHESRSFRLFTEAGFWLSQREGRAGYARILRDARRGVGPEALDAKAAEQPADVIGAAEAFKAHLGSALEELRRRTCASLVELWLLGTEQERAEWFGWTRRGVPPELSPKTRSFHVADALFRYLALFAGLLAPQEAAIHVCTHSLFAPCPDERPYRVAERQVAEACGIGVREVQTQRKAGVAQLLRRGLALLRDGDPLTARVATISLRASVLHLYKIDDDELGAALKALRRIGDK